MINSKGYSSSLRRDKLQEFLRRMLFFVLTLIQIKPITAPALAAVIGFCIPYRQSCPAQEKSKFNTLWQTLRLRSGQGNVCCLVKVGEVYAERHVARRYIEVGAFHR